MAVGDVLELVIGGHSNVTNDQFRTVCHWMVNTEDGVLGNERNLVDSVYPFYVSDILPKLSSHVDLDFVAAQRVFPLPRTAGYYQGAGGLAHGGISSDMLPPQCAVVIRKRTANAGRRYRGRVFQWGIPEAYQDNGILSGASYNALVGAWNTLLTEPRTGEGDWLADAIIWPKNGVLGSQKLITSTFADTVVRSQRRREVGKGA